MLKTTIILILCHLIGDYFMSSDYIQTTKGSNWYHMFVHCALYCIPLAITFGLDGRLLIIFIVHFQIDTLKARWKLISYTQDQIFHYMILLGYLF